MRRTDEPTDWREGRRLRAYELKQQGWSQKMIAQALGVTEGAVSQWMKRAAEQGKDGLKRQPPPGASPRLSDEQRAQLPALLAKGAEHYGFLGEVWTQDRVRSVIERVFGVSYDWVSMTESATFATRAEQAGAPSGWACATAQQPRLSLTRSQFRESGSELARQVRQG